MKQLYFKKSNDWREWLKNNYEKEKGVWLVFYKKETGKPTLSYDDALDEALCFGWIDSIIKNVDEAKYLRKFTQRNVNSKWSEINKKKVAALIKENRMTDAGLLKINAAKLNGKWNEPDRPVISFVLTGSFEQALNENKKAKEFFNKLAPTYQKQFIGWISVAKQAGTKEKRIRESILLLEKGQKLGLK